MTHHKNSQSLKYQTLFAVAPRPLLQTRSVHNSNFNPKVTTSALSGNKLGDNGLSDRNLQTKRKQETIKALNKSYYGQKVSIKQADSSSDPSNKFLKTIDWLNLGIDDPAKRYEMARKIDVLDVGTSLGQVPEMHHFDFLQVLPDHVDVFARERAKVRYETARQMDWLDVGTRMG